MNKLIISTLILLNSNFVQATKLEVNSAKVEFVAKGFPSFLKIKGHGNQLIGSLEKEGPMVNGKFEFSLKSLTTDLDLRDEHMKEKYLEVEKYPNAKLRIRPFELKESGKTRGLLTLHNETKEVEIDYTSEKNEHGLKLLTHFQIQLDDFKIDIPSFQGITVAKTIDLSVNFKAK